MAITLLVSIAHPKIRFVLMLHQLAFNRRVNPTRRKITKYIDSLLIRFSYTTISAGNYVAIQAKEITHEKYHKKIKKVLTTVQNSGNYHPSSKQPFKACFAGSIEPDKGIYSLIQSIGLLPHNLKSNLEISLCGSMGNSSFVQQCKTLIDHNQLNHVFIWRDFTNWPQLKDIYERSQLYLFPSFSENMPMSLMEAMSCGTVPICFNMSAMPLFITHNENGLLAAAKNHIDYANQIAHFFNLPYKDQQNLAANANISAQAYIRDWNTIGEEFLTTITAN